MEDPNLAWWFAAADAKRPELLSCEGGRYACLANIEEHFDGEVECDLTKWVPESIYPMPPQLLRRHEFFFATPREVCPVYQGDRLIAFLVRSAR